jgi:nucleoside-diphosphate-sugar epimerase
MRVAVTGAYGYSGQYMARRLLDQGHEVLTLTNSTHRSNPFGDNVKAQPFNFSNPALLEETLGGVDVLINNYWVRFDLPPLFTYAGAVVHAKTLFEAAKRAGIARIVHISITNPDRNSELPYFSGKAEMEGHLRSTGLSYCILRPTVLFGKEDILINNIAWCLRHLPVFGVFGDGRYRLQPIYVDDLAEAAVLKAHERTNETIDAIGPETFRYREMVEMIAAEIGVRPHIVFLPPGLAYQITRVVGWFVNDVVITREEIRGLMEERLYVNSSPLGTTKLNDWVHANSRRLGLKYTSEMARRLDRVSQYRSN